MNEKTDLNKLEENLNKIFEEIGLKLNIHRPGVEETSFAAIDEKKEVCYIFREESNTLFLTFFNSDINRKLHEDIINMVQKIYRYKLITQELCNDADKLLQLYLDKK